MKDIKFRAWCKKDSMMYDVYSIEFLNGGIKVQGTGVYIGNGWATELNGFKHDCDVELMQFTGLKCDKGVEIYEGDIVRCYDLENDGFLSQSISGVVEFHGGSFCVKCDKGYYNTLAMTCASSVDLVGNIHENPELLNK